MLETCTKSLFFTGHPRVQKLNDRVQKKHIVAKIVLFHILAATWRVQKSNTRDPKRYETVHNHCFSPYIRRFNNEMIECNCDSVQQTRNFYQAFRAYSCSMLQHITTGFTTTTDASMTLSPTILEMCTDGQSNIHENIKKLQQRGSM